MAHAHRAHLLQDEFEVATGVRPNYPRSRVAIQNLREVLDRYNAANANKASIASADASATAFVDEFARLGQIDVVDDFDLDIPTSAGELEGEAGRLLRRAKAQHRQEGATHVFSSWRQESPDDLDDLVVDDNIRVVAGILNQDYTLTSLRATELLQKIRGEFIFKIKFIREHNPDIWVVEDGFAPLNQVRGGGILVISTVTAPGALVGIDRFYYANAYPVSAVVYGLYPIREPDQNNLAPMREGYFHFVAQRVIEHFENAQKGLGMTEARGNKIKAWEVNVRNSGATLVDVSNLEKILRRAIIVRDIAGVDLLNSGKYKASRWTPVEVVLHNGHAWGANLHFPQAREVHIYEGDVWKAIKKAVHARPRVPSSCFEQGSPWSSPRSTVWPRRCVSEGSRPRPTTASFVGMVRPSGRPTEWDISTFPASSSGMKSAQYPSQYSRPFSVGLTPGASRLSVAGIRDSHHP